MELSQNVALETKQILSQSQIQSLEILAMDAVELDEYLQNEYMSNPMLDCTLEGGGQAAPEQEVRWFEAGRRRTSRNDDDEDYDSRDTLAAPDPDYLKNYFLSQIEFHAFTKEEWKLADFMVGCLEDDGFYRMSVEETATLAGVPEAMVEKVLCRLRDLEPFGVFSANLSECLLKQLEVTGEDDEGIRLVISRYLPEVSEGKISVISRQTGFSTAEIRKMIARIEKLNPKPLSGMRQAEVSYIVPDIVYSWKEDGWEIAINDRWSGNYHINEYYLQLMRGSADPELSGYFKKNLERCRFILHSVEQRRETMTAIARALLARQEAYFSGKGKLVPMTMCTLAEEMNVHPSTVSRAVKGKYIKSPAGTILMKKLFCGSATCEKGGELSADHIKERIRALVDSEDKRRPYSDARLVELLVEEGIHISRRAVAKYRDELWIKSSFDRKVR
ncbi:MAG TPA: RNA polymerase factor sigma-54 [Candidatus Anaerobutyricum stercoripullorum]|uniref:RNA polymerase factor sigma-54 n=1 Tax=Candidatus Anaerobutyricum stercoripullorum TaxID=2838456 RepID=A0A9D2BER9_9FIRM|nr:RNA polymerase factor sigma-54 [Candidatus Anaerobutyricum stercoripullorum]